MKKVSHKINVIKQIEKTVDIVGNHPNQNPDRVFLYINYDIQSLFLGNDIKKIGAYAFAYCNNLSSVILPDKLAEIGNKLCLLKKFVTHFPR